MSPIPATLFDVVEVEKPIELHVVAKKCCGEEEDSSDLQAQITALKERIDDLEQLVTTFWNGSTF
jgi:hypothetical protein